MGIDDTTGAISGAVTSAVVSGGLFVWGLIHKVIKGDQVDPSPALDARRQHLQEAAGGTSGWPHTEPTALDGTSIDPGPKQPESVPEKTV